MLTMDHKIEVVSKPSRQLPHFGTLSASGELIHRAAAVVTADRLSAEAVLKSVLSTCVLALLLLGGGLTAEAAQPPLPRLNPDSYPAAARAPIAKAYENAAAHPGDAQAVGELGRILQAWEQWDAAHDAYTRAQALAPRTLDWPYLDAVVLQRLARNGEAAERLVKAVAASPGYLPARVKLAEALVEAGTLDDSARRFQELAREPAAEPAAQFGLGRIAAAQGHHEAAIEHLQRATSLFPEFGAAYYALARSYRALGRNEDAQRALEKHAQYGARWPGQQDPVLAAVADLRADPRAQMQRGVALAERGDLNGAIAAHEAALVGEPSLAQAHENLITLYGRAGNWAKAEEHYRALLALGSNLDDAHYNFGVLLGMQNRWDEAAAAYQRALAVNPLHARAHNNLGQIFERERKLEAAAAEYREAARSQPTFRLARFNLGRMLLAQGRSEEAIVELEKLIEPRDAEAPPYIFALATAYVRSGHQAEGIRWATEARQLALKYGDTALAAAIERDLASIR
jgi:tetratricopeptide (TPR) repeat protein